MEKLKYEALSPELVAEIGSKLNIRDDAVRRRPDHDKSNLWRPCYVRDVEKILHSPYYNRYADKTQVFSFYKNDDISRRALHVQLVSRIARNIGRMLGLDLDLIEAIALGHDIGHTPFGHAGERFLSQLYHNETGRYFNHNVHSVRVLDGIFHFNISLQTLDGILCHNGEFECKEYRPSILTDFAAFDKKVEECYVDEEAIDRLVPNTLEGCVVRICDMIAYIGKDRQDAVKAKLIKNEKIFDDSTIGSRNAQIINNLIVNVIENSYGKDYICLDQAHFEALSKSKKDNYELIYKNKKISQQYDDIISPMFERIYYRMLEDVKHNNTKSAIYKHHIALVNHVNQYYDGESYEATEANQIVVDYIASMTDDYFIELYERLFPEDSSRIEYISYFDEGEGADKKI